MRAIRERILLGMEEAVDIQVAVVQRGARDQLTKGISFTMEESDLPKNNGMCPTSLLTTKDP